MKQEEVNVDLCLLDVLRGYSKFVVNKKNYYFKHFKVYDELKLTEFQHESFLSCLKNGIKGEKDLLEAALKNNFWTQKEEDEIKSLKWVIDKSESALSKVSDYMARKAMKMSIDKDKEKLKVLQDKKASITAHSAENLAQRTRYSKTLEDNIYLDEAMTQNIDRDDLFYLIPEVSEKIDSLSNRDSLLKMAYDPYFFDLYSVSYRNPLSILNVDIYNISIWQKNLFSYASVLLNKLKNYDMPSEVRVDPIKIYKFSPKEDEPKDGSVVHGVEDLRQKMSKKGGKLDASDF